MYKQYGMDSAKWPKEEIENHNAERASRDEAKRATRKLLKTIKPAASHAKKKSRK
jgi:hypothetical protein